MLIELKTIKLTKSKIQQMDYIGICKDPNVEVLGWVNLDKKRYVIIKSDGCFYRADFITKIEKELKSVEIYLEGGRSEFFDIYIIKGKTYNGGFFGHLPERDIKDNIELYNNLITFKQKTESAGQIYYYILYFLKIVFNIKV